MFPVTGLRLLLPALLPSWRFFDAVAASPRVDYAVLADPDEPAERWHEFRPRPPVLTPGAMLRRLLWNAPWNEGLFLVSLAERLLTATSADTERHSQRELLLRVARHLDRHGGGGGGGGGDGGGWLQIRVRLVRRSGATERIDSEIAYLSSPCPIAGLITR